MHFTKEIEGYEVNIVASKDGTVREACVMIGSPDEPGMRSKDMGSMIPRQKAKSIVAKALNLDRSKVKVSARYSCMKIEDGMAVRRDESGKIISCNMT